MATTSKSTAETKTTAETGDDATQRFTAAYADWTQQQQEISINYQRQCSDAYFQLMNDLNEFTTKSKRPIEEAQLKLMLAGRTANANQENWQNYQQLQQDYNKLLADFQNDQSRHEAFQKIYESFNAATQRAHEDAQKRMTRSNQEYLKVLKEGWSRMNVENLSPTEKHAIEWSTKIAFQAGIL
jgi:hypothetical protein